VYISRIEFYPNPTEKNRAKQGKLPFTAFSAKCISQHSELIGGITRRSTDTELYTNRKKNVENACKILSRALRWNKVILLFKPRR
jgi:hypothetical protein